MTATDTWLVTNGATLAAALDEQREPICAALSERLAAAFPLLCYDPARPDGQVFQQQMLRRTPMRLHTLLQSTLRLRSLAIVEREYRWAWELLQRYGVTRQHMIAQVYWYFEVARTTAHFQQADRLALNALEIAVVQIVERATIVEAGVISDQRGRGNGHAVPSLS